MPEYHCLVCGRPLTTPASRERGTGPICAGNQKEKNERRERMEHPDRFDLTFDEDVRDIVCKRDGWQKSFNFPHAVARHSPDGMEWGYAGSGPSDFAINALLAVTENEELATNPRIYQQFKLAFVVHIPEQGGTIRGASVEAWLKTL